MNRKEYLLDLMERFESKDYMIGFLSKCYLDPKYDEKYESDIVEYMITTLENRHGSKIIQANQLTDETVYIKTYTMTTEPEITITYQKG